MNSISTEEELNEFKDLVAYFFAQRLKKAIDALWEEGIIDEHTIEQWGAEHMRTPYRHASESFLTPTASRRLFPAVVRIIRYGRMFFVAKSVCVLILTFSTNMKDTFGKDNT